MAAASQREQREEDDKADERPLNPTRHERDNVRNSVKNGSMIAGAAMR
jgi:hypothetical protein